jgi:hypothetical protein
MGFFSGMANLFHSQVDDSKKAAIRGEINLAEAVEAHVHWKIRLQNYLNGKSDEKLDPMIICRDDQCVLGKWIHGPAMHHFHEFEPFHQLRSDHAQFHYVAANVVKHVQENNRTAAEAILHDEYSHISHKVVMSLTELNKLVSE